jgi:beta-lactam-binding protein with PASTA domain
MSATARRGPRIVAALIGGLTVILLLAEFGAGTPRRHMPQVMGQTKKVALERMAKHDLVAELVVEKHATKGLPRRERGLVVHQTWDRGMALPRGSTVTLTFYPKRAGRKADSARALR